ncbi:MAG: iron-containing alcohol dehydrogenase [Firmicutes bacterium]|jgi:alcohol dehydrogenase class IV|nr:iron-containing alcohol dehydrogenase [Bacillota bacterium]
MTITRTLGYPARLVHAHGLLAQAVAELVPELGPRPFVLYGRSQSKVLDSFCHWLPNATFCTYPGGEPELTTINQLLDGLQDATAILAIGGGSVLDSAKLLGVLWPLTRQGLRLTDVITTPDTIISGLPVIAVPTTAGTGSEVTPYLTVTLTNSNGSSEKRLLTSRHLVPQVAILDATLTLHLPEEVTRNTGIDAFTHALEAFVSLKSNPWSDPWALAAVSQLWLTLPVVLRDPLNFPARQMVMEAATMAGFAFAHASVALVHGMSRPLGAWFHLPHGYANAILLPTVMRFSLPHLAPDRERLLRSALELSDGIPLADAIEGWLKEMGVTPWPEHHEARNHLLERAPTMAHQALSSGSPANNPKVPDVATIVQLYQSLATV